MKTILNRQPGRIYILFTAPPGPHSEFVEVENSAGESIGLGQWVEFPDGLIALEFDPLEALKKGQP